MNKKLLNSLRTGDFIIILFIILLAVSSGFLIKFTQGDGDTVVISVNGDTTHRVSINRNLMIELSGFIDKSSIVIEGGSVWMQNSPCPHKLCKQAGKISRSGEMIICIPNRIVIQITGDRSSEIDAVTL